MRAQLSLLLSEGHANAEQYPLGMIWDEAILATRRRNVDEANRVTLLQMAVSGVIAPKANKHFMAEIKKLLKD